MTKREAVGAFLKNCLLPITAAVLLFFIFRSACMKDGSVDYFLLWLLCSLPFGYTVCFCGSSPAAVPSAGALQSLP